MTTEPEAKPGGQIGTLVLVAAVPSLAMGLLLLWLSQREPELFWYGLGVTAGGLALLGIWIRWRLRGDQGIATDRPPGKWFLVALFTIVLLQIAYLLYRRFN